MSTLKDLRELYNFTQREIAERAGISLLTYQNIEAGKADPKLSTVLALKEAFQFYYPDGINNIIRAIGESQNESNNKK